MTNIVSDYDDELSTGAAERRVCELALLIYDEEYFDVARAGRSVAFRVGHNKRERYAAYSQSRDPVECIIPLLEARVYKRWLTTAVEADVSDGVATTSETKDSLLSDVATADLLRRHKPFAFSRHIPTFSGAVQVSVSLRKDLTVQVVRAADGQVLATGTRGKESLDWNDEPEARFPLSARLMVECDIGGIVQLFVDEQIDARLWTKDERTLGVLRPWVAVEPLSQWEDDDEDPADYPAPDRTGWVFPDE